jgi:diguanylate cyclase (GGDEF)-like protein
MDQRQKKRILIFLIFPVLLAVLLYFDDPIIKAIVSIIMLVYVGSIIFLRDSLSKEIFFEKKEPELELAPVDADPSAFIKPDEGEEFKIISPNKKVEIITNDNFKTDFKEKKITLKPPDLKEKFEEIANEKVPEDLGNDGQFTFVLEKVLSVIKESYQAYTAVFFWYNKRKEKLSIERFVSNSTDITRRKFDVEDDILSKIIQKEEPELLNEVNPAAEADAIRYYPTPQGIKSFVGVPLFYDKNLVGILTIDSLVSDSFGIETIYSLGRFVRLITILINLFEEKQSESIAQLRLKGILNLCNLETKFETEQDLYQSIENVVRYLIHWDAFAFVYYFPIEHKFKTARIINKTSLKYIGENLDIELSGTLVGKSIVTGIPVKIDDTSANNYVRFSNIEDVSFDGSFLAIPLIYENQNYGVLCFESLKKNAYMNSDVQFLKSATNILSFILFSYSTQALLKSYVAIDIDTNALNYDTFKNRLSSDLIKSVELKVPGALALIKMDDFLEQESLFDGNPFPKVLKSISDTIMEEMTPLTLFGRLDEKVFGVYFFNHSTKDVFLWAEKLRVKIARQPIAVVSKQTTYTVSIGVASASNKADVDELIYNANLALEKALERGGNTVRNLN